jgi:hypothetical protein
MQKSIKVLILSLLAWDVCVGFSIAMMDMMAHRRQLNPGGTRYLIWASIMGFAVILLSYPLCRMLRGVPLRIGWRDLGTINSAFLRLDLGPIGGTLGSVARIFLDGAGRLDCRSATSNSKRVRGRHHGIPAE